ncbi:MAG TPA: hypothetical protein VKE74_11795 [Gemmataceae bacterium]|nr:hypothetical protein [Gemmataceae bacterium]
MNRLFGALALSCLLTGGTARLAEAETKTGEIKFTGPKKESVKVALGDKLKLEVTFQQIQVDQQGGVSINGTGKNTADQQSAVSVHGTVKNTADVKMHYSYNVAFLDKDKNLIGCQNFYLYVEAGKQGPVGTFIQLPSDQIARIAYYSVAFYESDKPIGSK